MEDTLQPLETVQIRPNKPLVIGIAVSVVLHLSCVFVLLGLPSGPPAPSPLVTYVDLNAIQHPAPLTVPPLETTPPKVVQPQLPPPAPEPPVSTPLPPQPEAATPQPEAATPQPEAATLQPVPPQETKVEEQRSHTIMGLGLTKGYFKSLGEGESLRAGIKGYYLEMLQSINERWWIDQKIDKRRLAPVVINITVARNGDIVASRILRSSGHPLYDKAVLAALTAASPLPPLPADYDQDFFQAPIRLVPPLNLMAW